MQCYFVPFRAGAISAYNTANEWDNSSEDTSIQEAVFVYDPLVAETRAVCVKDLSHDANIDSVVICMEAEMGVSVKDRWFDRDTGVAVFTMENAECE